MAMRDQYQTGMWDGGAARAQKRRSSLSLIAGLIILALITFAAFAYAGYKVAGLWLTGGLATGQWRQGGSGTAEAAPGKAETILLIGIDQRVPNEPSRSDTIMLATL
ncbi:hypothetical protein SDD30_15500, partial [Moorella naiadis]|uniref:hypothetical protein n=1 Tax=Moorella naiadis (nom. illeg.) TaxID=3093670 RepID=UPI003D9CA87D